MPNIDLTNVAEVSGSGNYNLEPGGYVMVVTDFNAPVGKEYVQLMLDVAEGPHKGFYARSKRPLSVFLNWSESMRGRCKHMLHQFADSNPGFDSNAAFLADAWQQFVGRSIGCIVRMEMHTYQGKDYENSEVADVTTPAAIRGGDFVVPGPRDRRERRDGAPAPNPPMAPTATPERMPWD